MITSGTVKFIRPSNYAQGYPGAEVTINFVVPETRPEEYKVWLNAAKIEARRTADELVYGTPAQESATIGATDAASPSSDHAPVTTASKRTRKPAENIVASNAAADTALADPIAIPVEPASDVTAVHVLPTQPGAALTAPLPALAASGSGAALPPIPATPGTEPVSSPLPALAPVDVASPSAAAASATAGGESDITDVQLKEFCHEQGNRISAVPGHLGQGINFIVKVRTEIAGDTETSVFKFDQKQRREFVKRLALEPVAVSL